LGAVVIQGLDALFELPSKSFCQKEQYLHFYETTKCRFSQLFHQIVQKLNINKIVRASL